MPWFPCCRPCVQNCDPGYPWPDTLYVTFPAASTDLGCTFGTTVLVTYELHKSGATWSGVTRPALVFNGCQLSDFTGTSSCWLNTTSAVYDYAVPYVVFRLDNSTGGYREGVTLTT